MADHVALLRGINVGTAKRVPMADLRRIVAELGGTDVATLLNSGNAVFAAETAPDPAALRAAVRAATGVDSEVVLLSAAEFREVAGANPLRRADREPKRLGVAFAATTLDPASITVPPAEVLGDEELVVTPRAVYQWLPNGVLASPVAATFWTSLGGTVTARNDATVLKIVALLDKRAAR